VFSKKALQYYLQHRIMSGSRRDSDHNDNNDNDNEDEDDLYDVNVEIVDLDGAAEDDFDDEDEEFQGLLGPRCGDISHTAGSDQQPWKKSQYKQDDKTRLCSLVIRGTTVAVVLLVVVLLLWRSIRQPPGPSATSYIFTSQQPKQQANNIIIPDSTESSFLSVNYTCPARIAKAANDKDDIFTYYDVDTKRHISGNVSNFMDMKYGAWGITPRQRKALNAKWIHWYGTAPLLKSGGTIYESACGVGLTLYVILELLQEHYNITNLEVYGNEYIPADVVTANQFYAQLQANNTTSALKVRRGNICHGDSTNLSFVPADSFDVVMTGYIDPIVDPLNTGWSHKKHRRKCKSQKPSDMQLIAQEQLAVEDWFAAWTTEMIRLAKDDQGTIIVESISSPLCLGGDWGGVKPKWWREVAYHKYHWDQMGIDPESIETIGFDPERQYEGLLDRYNVRMIKRRKPSKNI
jgi:SAM-dependent methyltransferase